MLGSPDLTQGQPIGQKGTPSTTHASQISLSLSDVFIYYVYSVLPACLLAGQKRAPDLITDGCEPPCGCWELNSGPLEEQSVLLSSEPSLQPCSQISYPEEGAGCSEY